MTNIVMPEPVGAVGRASCPGVRAGRYYPTYTGAFSGVTTAVPAVDLLYVYPFQVFVPLPIVSLAIRVATGGAGSAVKMAVYANGRSAALPVGAPIVADNTGQATTSNNSTVSATVSATLTPGIYWAASKFTGTLPIVHFMSNTSCDIMNLLGRSSFTNQAVMSLSTPDTYSNNLPTLTGGETWTDVVTSGCPILHLGT